MKKIIVCSDSHYNNEKLSKIASIHLDASYFFHLGDSEDYESNIYPFISVKGNNDYYINDVYKIISIDNHNFYLTHGHKIYLSDENLVRIAKKNDCDFILYGHTHRPYSIYLDGVNILNPGSLSYPRSAMGETYAIIYLYDDGNVNVEIVPYQ